MSIFLLLFSIILFIFSYFFYGNYIKKILNLNDKNQTPSHAINDGIDYVPTNRYILLGHHFASIAGVGPIIGPILGATFGWLPVFLWIVLGSIFIGAVHDFVSLVISMRKKGKTIGSLIEDFLGKEGKKVFLIFTWFTLILVIAVFTITVAKTFVAHPEVATASLLFVPSAIFFGYLLYVLKINPFICTLSGIIMIIISVFLGTLFPLKISYQLWLLILIVYIFFASIAPVWLLLQPRDYLNSFLLYTILFVGIIGVLFYRPEIKLEIFKGFYDTNLGFLFPILFVTVACGAISGFHSLVSSGTSSKQIDKESDTQLIGYGGMLLESTLAVLSLITAIMLTRVNYLEAVKNPISLFSTGMGTIVNSIGIPVSFAVTFSALAISAFALTSLDTSARLGRYTFEEFFEEYDKIKIFKNKFISSIITIGFGAFLTFNEKSALSIWPLFGSANQMLASLALITATAYFVNKNLKKEIVSLPAIFMFLVTVSALLNIIYKNYQKQNYVLVFIGIILFLTAIYIILLPFKYKNKILNKN